jgi:DNA-binding transcriptional ArsR family regulator
MAIVDRVRAHGHRPDDGIAGMELRGPGRLPGLTQPTISHHLKILVDAGIFTRDKRGVWAYYALVPSAMNSLSAVLSTGDHPVKGGEVP